MPEITVENYFSPEIQREYMSTSQFKSFMNCSAAALAELNGEFERSTKDAFTEGHMFEALTCGDEVLFFMQHPEVISSQGKTKGDIKSNYQKVVAAAHAFNSQTEFRKIVERCEKQVLVTGVIGGVKFRGLLDLFDKNTGEIFDTKCMKDFDGKYSADEGRYLPWWQLWGYHYQAAIYRELVRQTFDIENPTFSLLAATKEASPDVAWLKFSDEYLDNVYDIVDAYAPMYHAMKLGMMDVQRCEKCAFCRETKILKGPELIEAGEIIA